MLSLESPCPSTRTLTLASLCLEIKYFLLVLWAQIRESLFLEKKLCLVARAHDLPEEEYP